MDPLGVLLGNAWKRFAAKFWTLAWIFVLPTVFIIGGQLEGGRKGLGGGVAVAGGALSLVGTLLSVAATVALISALARGTGIAESYRAGMKLFWPAVWVGILNMVAVVGGGAMLIVPGVMIAISLVFANYALVLEGARGVRALRLSRFYVKGHWWAVFARLLFITVIFFAVTAFVYSPIRHLAGPVAGAVASFIILICYAAFSTAYALEMYENLRRCKADVAAGEGGADILRRDSFLEACFILGAVVFAFIILFTTRVI